MNDAIHDYRAFAHPLAQIKAVYDFTTCMSGFASDLWEYYFVDPAPDDRDVPTPVAVLTALQAVGLRFERSGPHDVEGFAYWDTAVYEGEALDVLLYGWAYQAVDALGVDSRIFWSGLRGTPELPGAELIFVPDHEAVVAPALGLLRDAERDLASVAQRLAIESSGLEGLRRTRPRTKKGGRREPRA